MRLIDADLLRSRLNIADVAPALDSVLKALIDVQKTIDAVPVVRCKDCKYSNTDHSISVRCTWCDYWGVDPDFDDFCSYGERKGGE